MVTDGLAQAWGTLPVAPHSPPGEVQQGKMRGFLGCRPVGEAAPDPTEEHLCSPSERDSSRNRSTLYASILIFESLNTSYVGCCMRDSLSSGWTPSRRLAPALDSVGRLRQEESPWPGCCTSARMDPTIQPRHACRFTSP